METKRASCLETQIFRFPGRLLSVLALKEQGFEEGGCYRIVRVKMTMDMGISGTSPDAIGPLRPAQRK